MSNTSHDSWTVRNSAEYEHPQTHQGPLTTSSNNVPIQKDQSNLSRRGQNSRHSNTRRIARIPPPCRRKREIIKKKEKGKRVHQQYPKPLSRALCYPFCRNVPSRFRCMCRMLISPILLSSRPTMGTMLSRRPAPARESRPRWLLRRTSRPGSCSTAMMRFLVRSQIGLRISRRSGLLM